jgi:hypothetical protein
LLIRKVSTYLYATFHAQHAGVHKEMRRTLFFILTLLQISVLSLGQETAEVEFEKFNAFLGAEKAAILNDAVDSFDRFLLTNYPDLDTPRDRSMAFLKQIAQHNEPKESWILETERNAKIIESFESTGLQKEIWLYGYENYEFKHDFSKVLPPSKPADTSLIRDLGALNLDLIEEDIVPIHKFDSAEVARIEKEWEEKRLNSLRTNSQGDFLYGLLKYAPKDSFTHGVAVAEHEEGNISPGVVSNGFLENVDNYDDPFVKRLMVTEFYFWIMNWDNRGEK